VNLEPFLRRRAILPQLRPGELVGWRRFDVRIPIGGQR
jgi:hypothetical protein